MDGMQYRPAPHVLDHLHQVDCVAVVGPTAVGKSTLITEAVRREPTIRLVLTTTNRPARADERDGVDIRFETRAAMEERIVHGEYVQVAPTVFGDIYATAAEDYPANGIALLPVLADALPVFRALPFHSMRCIFILPPDWQQWQDRIKAHGFNADILSRRLYEARRSLEFALHDAQTVFLVNDDRATAAEDFITLVLRKPLTERLQADQTRARTLVRTLISGLEAQQTEAIR
jgi:guanylate kinase